MIFGAIICSRWHLWARRLEKLQKEGRPAGRIKIVAGLMVKCYLSLGTKERSERLQLLPDLQEHFDGNV